MKLTPTIGVLIASILHVALGQDESLSLTHRKLVGGSLLGKGDILVQFRRDAPMESLLARIGALLFVKTKLERLDIVVLKPGAAMLLQRLGDLPEVEVLQEDAEYQVGSIPAATVASFPRTPWHLDRLDRARADDKYNYDYTGMGVDAYVLSTGVNLEHLDFGGRATCALVPVPFAFGCRDRLGAGTAEMAVLGGEFMGVAKDASLHMIKVFNRWGKTRTSILLRGLEYVVDQKEETGNPTVVSMSVSARFRDSALERAVERLVQDYGIPVTVAAGNDGRDACDSAPARASSVLTVGASTQADEVGSDSNAGPCVDLYAPGVGVVSASNTDSTSSIVFDGTGMASALAAGVAALYLEANPGLDGNTILESIQNTSVPGVLTGNPSNNLLLSTAGVYTPTTDSPTLAPTDAAPTLSPTGKGSGGPTMTVTLPFRINCGGDQVQVSSGIWLADQYFANGAIFGPLARESYSSTEDDALYKTERYDANLKYEIPIDDGTYIVTTYYSENYWEGIDLREFTIYAENFMVVEKVDIFQETGRRFRATSHSFTITVGDGILDLELVATLPPGSDEIDNGKLNALQIVKAE